MKIYSIIFIACAFWGTTSCSKKSSGSNTYVPPTDTIPNNNNPSPFFAKGADVSWLTEMEASGVKFYNSNNVQTDCIQLLKNQGINSIRLRVWVNPSNGWCNKADMLAKALRAKSLDMKIMIDFHYSDSWADPGQQNKPAAWASLDFENLKTSVYNHTADVMNTLKANSIIPDWVQIGNETNDGMLWPDGKASANMANYAALFKSGYNAVKAVSPASKVMVHISNGFDNALFRWNLDGLKSNGASWDIIGMSLYPNASNWSSLSSQCLTNMTDMVNRYGSSVMICEVGMSWTDSTACYSFVRDIINKTKSLSNNKGLGVFYWEPEAHNNWSGYSLGAFNNAGKPTSAMSAFN